MQILFTRHGESEANIQGIISNRDLPHKLTPVGVCQSLTLTESLLKWKITKVITSSILRAKETANITEEKDPHMGDFLLVSHEGILDQMSPLVLANVDRAFTKQHPIGNCELIITHPQNNNLVCVEWAGIKMG